MIENIILVRSKSKHEKRNEYSKPINVKVDVVNRAKME